MPVKKFKKKNEKKNLNIETVYHVTALKRFLVQYFINDKSHLFIFKQVSAKGKDDLPLTVIASK